MQQKLQQFVFLSERILSETGELRLRRTWNELSSVSVQLAPYMAQLAQNFDPKYALLYLLSCGNEGTQKDGCFSMLFRKILSKIPNKDLFSVLSSINRVELNSYLLPFLYEKGDIGSVAAYTSAKLGLKVNHDSFEFFLTSREWSQEDLVNLSFLVLAEQRDILIANLENIYNTNKKEVFAQFLNILKTSNIAEPVLPENLAPQAISTAKTQTRPVVITPKPNAQPAKQDFKFKLTNSSSKSSNPQPGLPPNVNSNVPPQAGVVKPNQINRPIQPNKSVPPNKPIQANQTVQGNQIAQTNNTASDGSNNNIVSSEASNTPSNGSGNSFINKTKDLFDKVKETVSNTTLSIPTNAGDNSLINKIKAKLEELGISSSSTENPLKQPPVIIVCVLILIIVIYLFFWLFSSGSDAGDKVVMAPPIEGKIPEYWVDAVTNQKITPQYIEADVDYRMGELYLSRNHFDEAIKFFSSALRIEPKHNIAKLRWGYAELLQGNYFVAKKLLKEVLAADSKMQNVNLYLARTSSGEKDFESAISYYRTEYRNHGSLDVGMEYANFLASIGQQDDAMDFLSVLQEKFPEKMLILNVSSMTSQSEKKTKTKG